MLKVGDYIECHDKEEMLDMSVRLGKAGIQTEFVYEMNGEGGAVACGDGGRGWI